jgi:Protein of unknown function (DUF3467)
MPRKSRKGTESKPSDALPLVTWSNEGESPRYYTNSVEVAMSVWDFRFRVAEIVKSTPGALTLKELVTIYMSPQHALVFHKILSEKIQQFEQKAGKITLPLEAE